MLQASEGRQPRHQRAVHWHWSAQKIAQQVQLWILHQTRRCYAACAVLQLLQPGTFADCMQLHRRSLSSQSLCSTFAYVTT